MNLKEFIEKFVGKNTLIRLWYKVKGGYEQVDGDNPKMEWQLANSEYANKNVLYVKDILVLNSSYVEAVNIVIER
jgi:hypothetical protein